ncbi:1869_t:CDS:2 [Paraglomus occultum]|uniref:1869_t:CDS:1 n=1 Tax=Paraglomus occultum TaxID=144539 RepID=A0A9N9GXY0_9GLOM|nr:1869_t:CDS:2 [Paraglomus occultum]
MKPSRKKKTPRTINPTGNRPKTRGKGCRHCTKRKNELKELFEKIDRVDKVANDQKVTEENLNKYADWPTEKLVTFMYDVAKRVQGDSRTNEN